MPLHFPSHKSRTQLSASPNNGATSSSVNKTATFGLGPGQWKVKDEDHSANLLANLRSLRTSGFLCDITFTYNEESINANRVILAAISPVMRNVFTKRESLLNAEAIPPQALHHLVQFIYNVNAEIRAESIRQIHVAAKVLKVSAVEKMCENLLQMMPVKHQAVKPPRPKLQRVLGFDDSSLGDDVTDGAGASDKENTSQISGSESTDSSSDLQAVALPSFKRDLRPSIKLTFHSQTSTPLNRSMEDLANAVSSSGSLETGCNDTPKRSSVGDVSKEALGERLGEGKRSEQLKKMSKSFEERAITQIKTKPRSGSCNNNNSPILLSSVLQEHPKPPTKKKSPSKKRRSSHVELLRESGNGTWPTRSGRDEKRPSIPKDWKKSEVVITKVRTDKDEEEVKVRKEEKKRKTRDRYTVGFRSKSVPGLLKGLNILKEQNTFCDLVLIVGNTRINCHKVVLAASSPVFNAIVRKIDNREIVLTKVEETAVQEIMKYIYNGQCTIDKENAMGILRAAYRFQFKFLVQQCANYLERNCSNYTSFFTADNVLLTYKLSGLYGCPRLREESRKFATSRFWELTETQAFKELTSIDLNRLISCESIRQAKVRDSELELQFFLSLIRWLTYKPEARLPRMTSRVMKFVHFENMKGSVLNRVVSKETVAMSDQATKQRILLALHNSHAVPAQSLPQLLGPTSPPKKAGNPGEVLAVVSHNDTHDAKKAFNKIYKVNQAENTWEDLGSTPAVSTGYAVTSWGNAIYVAGGRDVTKNRHTSCGVHKFENQQWIQLASMRIERSHFSLVPLDGTLYAIGGMTDSVEKAVPGYQITGCVEQLVIDQRRGNLKWKISSMSLPTPSYFHSAVSCRATMRHSALDLAFSKQEKNRSPLHSPTRTKPRLGPMKMSPTFNRSSPKQNALRYRKPSLGSDEDMRNHTITKNIILICGGKSKPMQNVMMDSTNERFVEKKPLPCPCTSPILASTESRAYLMSSGSVDSTQQVNALLHEYVFISDQWTEIKLPQSSIASSPRSSGKLTRLRASFRRDDKTANPKPHLACLARDQKLLYMVTTGNDVTLHIYDVQAANWTTCKQTKTFDHLPRSIRLLLLSCNL